MALQQFAPALPELQAALPEWWAATDPSSELYKLLNAIAAAADDFSAQADQLYLDQFFATASSAGLLAEAAYVYDLRAELNSTMSPDVLRGYIEAWIACDGSTPSVLNVLLAIINLNPANSGGPVLTFDAGGLGLTFPSNGNGLVMYQYATKPDQTVGFVFDQGGAGLTFPDQAMYFPGDGSGFTFPNGGGGLTFPNVPNLTFPNGAWVVITENGSLPGSDQGGPITVFPLDGSGLTFPGGGQGITLYDFGRYTTTFTLKSYLAFDRGAMQRAINRFRQAHALVTYTEVNT